MVMGNICHLLNSFLCCSAYENIIFCWVMHHQSILDDILFRLEPDGCQVRCISLTCSEEALRRRLETDIAAGLRMPDVMDRSLARLPLCQSLHTEKLDVSAIFAAEAARGIAAL